MLLLLLLFVLFVSSFLFLFCLFCFVFVDDLMVDPLQGRKEGVCVWGGGGGGKQERKQVRKRGERQTDRHKPTRQRQRTARPGRSRERGQVLSRKLSVKERL